MALLPIAAVLASANLSSCRQLIDNFHVQSNTFDDGGDTCRNAGYPQPPGAGRDSSVDDVEFVIALKSTDAGDFGVRDARIGLDLDGTCTTSADTASCVPMDPKNVTMDGPCCIDNALGQATAAYFSPGAITDGLQGTEKTGKYVTLLQVTGYNGMRDDPEVQVAVMSGTTNDGSGMGAQPMWDGTDVWKLFDTWLSDPVSRAPKHFAEHAYVTGNVLVAEFSQSSAAGLIYVPDVYRVIITGQLSKKADGYHLLNGTRTGRWAMPSVLAFLALLYQLSSIDDMGNCVLPENVSTNDPSNLNSYETAKGYACAAADLRIEGDDRTQPCDAMSIGVAMEGVPAQLGDVIHVIPTPICEPDTCSPTDAGTGSR
jgi:hypothetical protein